MDELDLPDVLKNECESYEFPWNEGIFRDCLRAGYACLVLQVDRVIIGHGIFQFLAGEAHILNVCVGLAHRQNGYARELLQHLFVAMQNRGVDTAYLEVRPSNQAAINLYTEQGFNQVGLRKNYYRASKSRGNASQEKEDALIMARYSLIGS